MRETPADQATLVYSLFLIKLQERYMWRNRHTIESFRQTVDWSTHPSSCIKELDPQRNPSSTSKKVAGKSQPRGISDWRTGRVNKSAEEKRRIT
jgi:hypothetical protein